MFQNYRRLTYVLWLAGALSAQTTKLVGAAANGSAPSISGFLPAATSVGHGLILTVNGANFLVGAVVNWNGTALPTTTFVSSTELTALVATSLVLSAGTASITVTNPDGQTSAASAFPINGPLTISPASLPNGAVGVPYPATLTVSGGVGPYTWSLIGPLACPPACTAQGCLVCNLPPGVSYILGPDAVTISGTPTAPGIFTFGFQVTDSNLGLTLQYYPIAVAPVVSIVCTPRQLNFTYSIGGPQPATANCMVDSAPVGLNFSVSASDAWLSGLPASGATPAGVAVSASTAGLVGGGYTGTLQVSVGGFPSSLPASLTVNPFPQCQFALATSAAALPSAGTSSGGVQPEVPVTVNIAPEAGTGCTGSYSAVSSASWLSATLNGNSFSYTALSSAHPAPRSATLTITNSGGGSQSFTVTEDGDTESLPNRQVRALYQSILGRDPDAAGFAFWTGAGEAGLGQMADSFLTSPEAFNSDFAVIAAYQAANGAVAGYAQYATAVSSVRAGAQTVAQWFLSLIGGNASYSPSTLYENLLGRAPTAAETVACAADLVVCFETLIGYPASQTPVTANNLDSGNALYIATLYYTILSRDYDLPGYNFWLGVANAGGSGVWFQGPAGYAARLQIVGPGTPGQGFIGSPEFQGLYQ